MNKLCEDCRKNKNCGERNEMRKKSCVAKVFFPVKSGEKFIPKFFTLIDCVEELRRCDYDGHPFGEYQPLIRDNVFHCLELLSKKYDNPDRTCYHCTKQHICRVRFQLDRVFDILGPLNITKTPELDSFTDIFTAVARCCTEFENTKRKVMEG